MRGLESFPPLILGGSCPISREVMSLTSKQCLVLEARPLPNWCLPPPWAGLELGGEGGDWGFLAFVSPLGSPAQLSP